MMLGSSKFPTKLTKLQPQSASLDRLVGSVSRSNAAGNIGKIARKMEEIREISFEAKRKLQNEGLEDS